MMEKRRQGSKLKNRLEGKLKKKLSKRMIRKSKVKERRKKLRIKRNKMFLPRSNKKRRKIVRGKRLNWLDRDN
jgi:hypothetical protein